MTRLIRFANNASSRLAANITNTATSVSVTPGEGGKFPAPTGGQYFMATMVKVDGTTEVVKVTARSTDTFTIVRAAEAVAGSATAYAFSAGDKIEARLTAGGLGGELDRLDMPATLNKSAAYSVAQADRGSLVRVDTTSAAVTITLPSIAALTDELDVVIAKITSDANAVTIARSSTDTINGATSYTLTTQFQTAWLIADRSTNTWTIGGGGVLADGSVTAAKLASDSVTNAKIADNAVNTAEIVDAAVTPAKLDRVYKDFAGAISQQAYTITADTTITSGNNGVSIGPVSIAAGKSVTMAAGSRWLIL